MGFGVLYNISVRQAFDFLFFNAVFNVYVCMLTYFYSPLPVRAFELPASVFK